MLSSKLLSSRPHLSLHLLLTKRLRPTNGPSSDRSDSINMSTNPSNGSGSPEGAATDLVETGKRLAAFAAVDDNVRAEMVVGVGSGSTIAYSVQRLAEKVREGMKGKSMARDEESLVGDEGLGAAGDLGLDKGSKCGGDEVEEAEGEEGLGLITTNQASFTLVHC